MADLVTLVVQSKKALHQAEAVCSGTHNVAKQSTSLIVDILATEAKVRLLSDGVAEQLQAAFRVAQTIQNQRATLQTRASQWDQQRNQRALALDSILESLAQQVVPPSLHEMAEASSLFGEQPSDSPGGGNANGVDGRRNERPAPTGVAGDTGFLRTFEEIRRFQDSQHVLKDQSKWRSLRDFVDERGIDEAADAMDTDRNSLDALLRTTASFPDSINKTAHEIQSILPLFSASATIVVGGKLSPSPASPPPPASLATAMQRTNSNNVPSIGSSSLATETIKTLLAQQDSLTTDMARNLEGLAVHYEQMSHALRDHSSSLPAEGESASPQHVVGSAETYRPGLVVPGREGLSPPKEQQLHARGVAVPARTQTPRTLTDEDMQVFIRDSEELPAILSDIEAAAAQVTEIQERLRSMAANMRSSLAKFDGIVDQLDKLADDMAEKLQMQQQVETQTYEIHETLDAHLGSFDQLAQTYIDYQMAYRRLLLEMDRRRRSREAMEELVHEMLDKLEQMREDEIVLRENFILEHGQVLPDDLCPFVQDLPVRWAVDIIGEETLPDIQESILVDARQQLERSGLANVPDAL
ncbi:autophagy protein 17 [Tulasnella sp. UAMH 9824]|nr:autophagy protein 17 [Tulasnella sp. UAMH 9824]